MRRRRVLRALAGLAGATFASATRAIAPWTSFRLAAGWDDRNGRHLVGIVEGLPSAARIAQTIEVPSRAHGVISDARGGLLIVARRPGEWLLHWQPSTGARQWVWSAPDRRFNGHAQISQGLLATTETDLESGAGLVALRNAVTFDLEAEWATHGIDPHELLVEPDGSLLVANGGVPTRPETGRTKHDLGKMDSSLVRLEGGSGRLVTQWRLPDPLLSIRHLARHAEGMIGVALQAEHTEPGNRQSAPVLALLANGQLVIPPGQPMAMGYGGSIASIARAEEAFAVSCPRTGSVALFDRHGHWRESFALTGACPLAARNDVLWSGGLARLQADGGDSYRAELAPDMRFDNHWVAL